MELGGRETEPNGWRISMSLVQLSDSNLPSAFAACSHAACSAALACHICAETRSFSHNLSRDSLILPHLHRDSLILPHLSRSPLPHLRRDCAHPAHICARTAPGAACCSCRDCAHNSACAKPTRLGQPAVAGQHATRSTQHATRNIRHATCNMQHATHDMQ